MGNTMMNASYQVGTMAVWLGTFADPEEFYRYVQTCYCTLDEAELDPEYIFSPAEFEERLHKLFRPENGERPEEATLRRAFRTQYNAFEYDFGLLFDEDFAVCDYCMEPTEDLSLLLEEWPELLEPVRKLVQEQNFREPVNCIFAVPSCMYTGPVRISNPQGGTLWFVGEYEESAFPTLWRRITISSLQSWQKQPNKQKHSLYPSVRVQAVFCFYGRLQGLSDFGARVSTQRSGVQSQHPWS